MAFRIVRQDITKMNTQAIVNTASALVSVGSGCDSAVYAAAGYDKLLSYRKEKIGEAKEGEAFITPGFDLPAEYIIHVVSPLYTGGDNGEEEKLRDCYRNSLKLAKEHGITSIAIPLIATGSFGYPKEEGMRIAVDEISAFLFENEMQVVLVVFDEKTTSLGGKLYPNLESYIDSHYVEDRQMEEYGAVTLHRVEMEDVRLGQPGEAAFGAAMASQCMMPPPAGATMPMMAAKASKPAPISSVPVPREKSSKKEKLLGSIFKPKSGAKLSAAKESACMPEEAGQPEDALMSFEETGMDQKETGAKRKETGMDGEESDMVFSNSVMHSDSLPMTLVDDAEFGEIYEEDYEESVSADFDEEHESRLEERMNHVSDTFSEYLLYLIQNKKMENAEVYKRAIVDKKTFSKIKNHPDYHPQKLTALCLCVGAKLKLDETKDLLARAGYALSPCDKTDIIFSYFIENGIYDMIELDIQLEEHGLACIIS